MEYGREFNQLKSIIQGKMLVLVMEQLWQQFDVAAGWFAYSKLKIKILTRLSTIESISEKYDRDTSSKAFGLWESIITDFPNNVKFLSDMINNRFKQIMRALTEI